jgi:drug/metabolite transporter (DMT)-like permease
MSKSILIKVILLVLLCAFGFAIQIILVARLHPTVTSECCYHTICHRGLVSSSLAFFMERDSLLAHISPKNLVDILFLSAFGTAFAYTIQIYAQKEMSAAKPL